ncbi:lipoprotein [Spiroplasma culicicola]|uniref:Lipoprotein n=1 Tax=Spiroplasma culicicola AES-1 TaxID=1276246 RepID=W6A7X4_9MOLU|nr:lipoprotein [Spiroplasma culicicola]AHI53091.1 hypothetical protein SCULI_v1c07500 [Spiroplasma culicicola AES-1]
MKKLLSILGSTALITTSTTSVLACSSNANYKEFLKWIDRQDTFLLYYGADNCPYCNQYQDALDMVKGTENSLENKLNGLNEKYNAALAAEQDATNPINDYGKDLVNGNIDYHEFKIEDLSDKWSEKWSENLYDWLVDSLVEIYIEVVLKDSNITHQQKINLAKPLVKTYIGDLGVPFFLLIRNGKLVNWTTGFGRSEVIPGEEQIVDFENWFNTIETDFMNIQMPEELVKKIQEANNGSGGEGETTDPATYNYDQINVNNYSAYFE